MPEAKQIERVIRILQRLALKPEITVSELYEYFERRVPKRTLQRDLIELSAANVPLQSREGKNRQLIWSLDIGYLKFIPITMQPKELVASWLLQTLAGAFSGTPLEHDAKSFINKARQLAPPGVFAELRGDLQPVFGMTFTGYIDYRPQAMIIGQLIEAITQRRVVRFAYKPHWKDSASVFEANPYMLLWHKGALYVVALSSQHGNYLFLPIQRIRAAEVMATKFRRERGLTLEKLREGRFGIFGYEGLKPQQAVLRFHKDIAEIIGERIWHPSQKIIRHRDGSLTLEMKVVISDELKGWVASWMQYVDVLSPTELRITFER
jgi:predicted DNA-binding transcriptional regulator YafY